jgi:hypothetical protein
MPSSAAIDGRTGAGAHPATSPAVASAIAPKAPRNFGRLDIGRRNLSEIIGLAAIAA